MSTAARSRASLRGLIDLKVPIVLAPLAGGPATVELAVAVADAGGLGFLAAGYLKTAAVRDQIEAFRARTTRPLGVNVFTAPERAALQASYAPYLDAIRAEAERMGVELGPPRFDEDNFAEKVALLTQARPEVVSFVFGCPGADVIERLRSAGITVLVTVTTPEEAREAAAAGTDALVVQGYEAGGHRGSAVNEDQPAYGLLALLQLVGDATTLPLIAAGGISTGRGLAAALSAGALAVQMGTAFLLCPEAGTADVHRAAIASAQPTAVTRAFTGKPARGIVNRFMTEYGPQAPGAYPEIHYATAPVRAAARERGDPDAVNLWAGQAHQLARAEPAADVVRRLSAEARDAIAGATARLRG